jgi:hypothetical protein
LTFSVRSVLQHWKGGGELVILSQSPPKVFNEEIGWEKCRTYQQAQDFAASLSGKRILWMNDDIFLLRDTDASDLLPPRQMGDLTKADPDARSWRGYWRRLLIHVGDELQAMGHSALNFSTHTPYLFEADKLKETLALFERRYKMPVETAYFNIHHKGESQICRDKLEMKRPMGIPAHLGHLRFLNVANGGLTPHGKAWIQGLFPIKSRFEK